MGALVAFAVSWKNTVQQGLPISYNPAIVYRGLPMACLNLGGTNAVQFGTTGFFQKLLAKFGMSSDSVAVGGAFLGGVASGVPCRSNHPKALAAVESDASPKAGPRLLLCLVCMLTTPCLHHSPVLS